MKRIIITAFTALLALPAMAGSSEHTFGQYTFVGTDNTIETRLCISAATDQIRLLKRQIQETGLRRARVAKGLNCNDINVTLFAYQYGATKTGDLLNRYSRKLGKTSIEDIASNHSDKPMIIYVSAK